MFAANGLWLTAAEDRSAVSTDADCGLGGHRATGQWWIACAEDVVRRYVGVQLGLHRRSHGHVRRHAESFDLERVVDPRDCPLKTQASACAIETVLSAGARERLTHR